MQQSRDITKFNSAVDCARDSDIAGMHAFETILQETVLYAMNREGGKSAYHEQAKSLHNQLKCLPFRHRPHAEPRECERARGPSGERPSGSTEDTVCTYHRHPCGYQEVIAHLTIVELRKDSPGVESVQVMRVKRHVM